MIIFYTREKECALALGLQRVWKINVRMFIDKCKGEDYVTEDFRYVF